MATPDSFRNQYWEVPLIREQLPEDPVDQFASWFQDAQNADIRYPHAMGLSTVSKTLEVSSRIVLLRYFDHQGFVFFTGYDTEKAAQISDNPTVALLFSWLELERQVRITGTAEKISHMESLKFFMSRSRESQIGAWLSQSAGDINSRELLKMNFAKARMKFQNKKIPLPDRWGGYRVKPEAIEFWQGHRDGVHDRIKYTWRECQRWDIQRLLP